MGFSKIMVDTAFDLQLSRCAATAICRDGAGNYMGSSALVINGLRDKTVAQAIACREGLALAEDLLLRDFIIASKSKQVINNIHHSSGGLHGNIIKEIIFRKTFLMQLVLLLKPVL